MFTPRDIMIVRLVDQGWTYQEIGRELGISRWTVKSRVSMMCRRLNVDSREDAVRIILTDDNTLLRPKQLARPTDRQLACLRLAMQGFSNKQIARSLEITQVTVKMHMSELYERIGAFDRCHAAMIAIAQGWVTLEELGYNN